LATAFCGAGGISPLRQSYSEASEAGEADKNMAGRKTENPARVALLPAGQVKI